VSAGGVTAGEPPNLKVSDLAVTAAGSGTVVVDEISFAVGAGQVMGLVGESGSGKTTIALALLGHARRGLRISRGQVWLGGARVLGAPPAELRRLRGREIAYVPQDPASALNPVRRIGAQLDEALLVHPGVAQDRAGRAARVAEVLGEAGLDADREMLRRYPHQLSGGQQQRVVLAMAFACRPRVIVMDEPTTGLDVSVQRHVLDTVRRLCASYGVAAVYVSHDLAVVNDLASSVAVVYAGRIVELGETGPVFDAPAHPYTRGLIASIPSPRRTQTLRGIAGQPPRPGQRPAGCAFGPRCAWRAAACAERQPEPAVVGHRVVRCVRTADLPLQVSAAGEPPPPSGTGPDSTGPDSTGPVPAGAARLVVRDLSASYGRHRALDGVGLEVAEQETIAIVGESGAGKTTLAHCIAGLNRNWTGSVTLDGEALSADMRDRGREQLRRVQYIFQNPYLSLNPRKTIAQIVGEPLRHFFKPSRADEDAAVRAALGEVSLGADYLGRYPDQLSGGERQRVAIARALVVRPEILVCDEVTSALDVSVQAVIVELLRRLQRERQLSMIFITHNLALVRSIAQRCVVLSQGQVVESGAVADILERPGHPYTARLIADMPVPPGALADQLRKAE